MYINDSLKIYPRFDGDIQLIQSGWTSDKPLPDGWEKVNPTQIPEAGVGEAVEEVYPEKIDGSWYQKWSIRSKTEEEFENERIFREEIRKHILGIGTE